MEQSKILENMSLSRLGENSTIVIKNFTSLSAVKPFLQEFYKQIFAVEMQRMCNDKSLWPRVNNYKCFCDYFSIGIHTQLKHLH